MSRMGMNISSFKDFIMSNSVPKKKGRIDKFELMEYIYEAVEHDDHAELSEDEFVTMVKEYLIDLKHKWNTTIETSIV